METIRVTYYHLTKQEHITDVVRACSLTEAIDIVRFNNDYNIFIYKIEYTDPLDVIKTF